MLRTTPVAEGGTMTGIVSLMEVRKQIRLRGWLFSGYYRSLTTYLVAVERSGCVVMDSQLGHTKLRGG